MPGRSSVGTAEKKKNARFLRVDPTISLFRQRDPFLSGGLDAGMRL
jgi:hypothetical protein